MEERLWGWPERVIREVKVQGQKDQKPKKDYAWPVEVQEKAEWLKYGKKGQKRGLCRRVKR